MPPEVAITLTISRREIVQVQILCKHVHELYCISQCHLIAFVHKHFLVLEYNSTYDYENISVLHLLDLK